MSELCLFLLKYEATALLIFVHTVSVFLQNMMMTRAQFPCLRYESPYCLLLVLLCCREAAFSNYYIVHVLPPPPLSHPDSLECWHLRHETA